MSGEHTILKEDFSGGEISPTMRGRISSPEYKAGSSLLYNQLPTGGFIRRRPGTRWVATLSITATAGNSRLVPFTAVYGQQFALVIEVQGATDPSPGTPSVFVFSMASRSNVQIISSNVPNYLDYDFASITWAQSNGMTWLFHRGYPVFYVSNAQPDGSGVWSATQPVFVNADANGETFGTTNHYPGCGEFYAGRLFMASTKADPLAIWGCTLPAPGKTQNFTIFTTGSTQAPKTITVVAAGKTFTRSAGSYLAEGVAIGDNVIFSGFSNAGNNGTFLVTTVTDLVITCSGATTLVNENGTGDETYTIGSTPNAASGIYLRQNDVNAPFIRWLFASQSILMGTDRAVWMYPDGITGTPPTPASLWFKKSATFGSLPSARPIQVNNVALYLGSDAKSFRSLILSMQRGYYADGELSAQAEHLMSRLCVDFCVTTRPDPTAWIRMADGSLVSASVRQEDSGFVVKAGCGFAQHSLGASGICLDMCQLSNTNWDELWMIVNRNNTKTLEYLYLDDVTLGPQGNAVYVDCSNTQTAGSPQSTFSGLPAILNGQTCWAFGDGGVIKGLVPSGGSVTLPVGAPAVSKFTIGLPYFSAWQDVYPEVPGKGTSQGKIKMLQKSWLRVVNSLGAWVGQVMPADPLNNPGSTLATLWDQLQTFGIEKYGNSPAWVTQDLEVQHAGSAYKDGRVLIVVADPVPFNLAMIATRVVLSEN